MTRNILSVEDVFSGVGDALKYGAAAGSAWLAYNTGGAAAGLIAEKGSATYALASSTIGGAVGSTSGQLMNGMSLNDHGFLRGVAGGVAGGAAGAHILLS